MARNLREDFPFIKQNPDLIYFDSAATALKPQSVLDAVMHYYTNLSSNVHRGDYDVSIKTSEAFDAVRKKVAQLLHTEASNIIFTSGASESLNLVAWGLGKVHLQKGDVILLNEAEHASNVLPWFHIAKEKGAVVEFIPLNQDGMIGVEDVSNAMHDRVRIVSMAHVSNVIGYVNDIKEIGKVVHQWNALLVVDGAQSIGHMNVDVEELNVDFYAFSAHKMMGPSGVGVLYGKHNLLDIMEPLSYGGGSNARFNVCGDITLKEVPYRFESGTPNIEGVLGFGAAIDYLLEVGFDHIHKHEVILLNHLVKGLGSMEHIEIYNQSANTGILTFNVKGIYAQDVAGYLNHFGICVRSGNHCSKLVSGLIKQESTLRLSLYLYNTVEEIDRFLEVIRDITLEKAIDIYL